MNPDVERYIARLNSPICRAFECKESPDNSIKIKCIDGYPGCRKEAESGTCCKTECNAFPGVPVDTAPQGAGD